MGDEKSEGLDRPLILHCFADYGTESEILSNFGDVIRVTKDPKDTNASIPVRGNAFLLQDDKTYEFPIKEDVTFDLGVFHPVCSKWAATTSISGDPDSKDDMIPSARKIAKEYCDHYIIENVPKAPLKDPTVLNGRMFGLPIEYERAFETSFKVPQPPRERSLLTTNGPSKKTETSSFYFSERSKEWWAATKQYNPDPYTKQHLAKNTIPAQYIYYLLRMWLMTYEEETGISEGRVDYSTYDKDMKKRRRETTNQKLADFDDLDGESE
ncbi:hypothetical protein [Halogranum rubrum]|uniref:Uncharacterized protein n=1 Tax=Halogranum salarium B-1 TaxID=1210908 RepID=J2ZAS8_9EURY|nr:hypothetical protein [Halogranum salarium]EJN57755.1 hypothetical protein HSB1_39030 [Halogranum salarium B-1]